MLAGLDFPDEERRLHDAVAGLGWAERIRVGNDTFAVLRAGTDAGWGIAVTCGTGINCVGIGPDGRHARFPSLGAITGDWGGGFDLGVAALGAAARSQDGRGPATSLQHLVPAHFGLGTPVDVAEAIHTGTIRERRLSELARVVFGEAERDELCGQLIERLAAEVADFVRATIDRLELGDRVPEVLLGGGLMQAAGGYLVKATATRLGAIGLEVVVQAVSSPPIVGAALLALDEVVADRTAHERVRRELESAAFAHADGADPGARDGPVGEQHPREAGVTGHG
jgi:N-acetylglucosamine kinase-like BadF-type ATPase